MKAKEEIRKVLFAFYHHKDEINPLSISSIDGISKTDATSIGQYLESCSWIQGKRTAQGYCGKITTSGRFYVEDNFGILNDVDREESNLITMKEKYNIVLKALYHNGAGFNSVSDILNPIVKLSSDEYYDIGKQLEWKGQVSFSGSKYGVGIRLTASGREHVENYLLNIRKYKPHDTFSESEISEQIKKLDMILEELRRNELRQNIAFEKLLEEFETMKDLLRVLGKKDWMQTFKGKMVDAGLGEITGAGFKFLMSVIENPNLLS